MLLNGAEDVRLTTVEEVERVDVDKEIEVEVEEEEASERVTRL